MRRQGRESENVLDPLITQEGGEGRVGEQRLELTVNQDAFNGPCHQVAKMRRTPSRGLRAGALRGSSCVNRCGASLNRHRHDHGGILDGVFEPLAAGGVQFRQAAALAPEQVAVIEAQVR